MCARVTASLLYRDANRYTYFSSHEFPVAVPLNSHMHAVNASGLEIILQLKDGEPEESVKSNIMSGERPLRSAMHRKDVG